MDFIISEEHHTCCASVRVFFWNHRLRSTNIGIRSPLFFSRGGIIKRGRLRVKTHYPYVYALLLYILTSRIYSYCVLLNHACVECGGDDGDENGSESQVAGSHERGRPGANKIQYLILHRVAGG